MDTDTSNTCLHTGRLNKEYLGGMDTGDKICADCGQVLSPAEVRMIPKSEE